jgi:AmmeMemoRadiSam system protein A
MLDWKDAIVTLPTFTDEERRLMLRWAHEAVRAAVTGAPAPRVDESTLSDSLRARLGVFVTLTKRGDLRGCIGKMDYNRPLWENLLDAAVATALEDPRFNPVQPNELGDLKFEISVVTPPEDLPRVDLFEPRRHGIVIERGLRHGLLLPKVARDYGWDARKTLEMVCWKAGLPPDAWRAPDARLQVFEAVEIGDETVAPPA